MNGEKWRLAVKEVWELYDLLKEEKQVFQLAACKDITCQRKHIKIL